MLNKELKKTTTFGLAVLFAFCMFFASGLSITQKVKAAPLPVTTIDITMHAGDDTLQVMAHDVLPSAAASGDVTWECDAPDIVRLEPGLFYEESIVDITPLAKGEAVITVTGEDEVFSRINVHVTDAYLYVGEKAVTESSDVFGDGKVVFDADTNTLTITDYTLDASQCGTTLSTVFFTNMDAQSSTGYVDADALISYHRRDMLNIVVNGTAGFVSTGENGIGIAVSAYYEGLDPVELNEVLRTGTVSITGGTEDAALEFDKCGFAAVDCTSNYIHRDLTPDGRELPNLTFRDLRITSEDFGKYGILCGRCMDMVNVKASIKNKELGGVRAYNYLYGENSEFTINNIGQTGFYASGNGFDLYDCKIDCSDVEGFAVSAVSFAYMTNCDVNITGCNTAAITGSKILIDGGNVQIADSQGGIISSFDTSILNGAKVTADVQRNCLSATVLNLEDSDVILTSKEGFAASLSGNIMGASAGLIMNGGRLEATSNEHAAIAAMFGISIESPLEIKIPAGGAVVSTSMVREDDLFTIVEDPQAELNVIAHETPNGIVLDDIEGAASHVVISSVDEKEEETEKVTEETSQAEPETPSEPESSSEAETETETEPAADDIVSNAPWWVWVLIAAFVVVLIGAGAVVMRKNTKG